MEAICADGTKKWAVQTVAGSTRHDPARAFTDGRPVSVGVTGCEGQRNAPTILNSLYNLALFWDGHAKALEDQASLPIINPCEMGQPNVDTAVAEIAKFPEYQQAFPKVFGRPPNGTDLVRAIASYFLASLTSSQHKEQGIRELERQRALSRTDRPQRDTPRAFGRSRCSQSRRAIVRLCQPLQIRSDISSHSNQEGCMSDKKTAIITGASQGIGAGLVEGFLKEAYNVVATSLEVSHKLTASPSLVLVDGDIGKQETAVKAVEAAIQRFRKHRCAGGEHRNLLDQTFHRLYYRGLPRPGLDQSVRIPLCHPAQCEADAETEIGERREHLGSAS